MPEIKFGNINGIFHHVFQVDAENLKEKEYRKWVDNQMMSQRRMWSCGWDCRRMDSYLETKPICEDGECMCLEMNFLDQGHFKLARGGEKSSGRTIKQ